MAAANEEAWDDIIDEINQAWKKPQLEGVCHGHVWGTEALMPPPMCTILLHTVAVLALLSVFLLRGAASDEDHVSSGDGAAGSEEYEPSGDEVGVWVWILGWAF